MKKYQINHLGKTLNTDHWHNLSVEDCNIIRKSYYDKPDFEKVSKNLKFIFNGGLKIADIMNYYVKDLMSKVKNHSSKWSVEEMLQSDDLIRYFYSRILSNNKVYPKNNTIIKNFKIALQLSGNRVALKPSNFPMKTIDEILELYNTNNNYYDFSCGWGVRMLSSMKHNINYYGTEPNYLLVDRLNKIHSDYNKVNNTNTYVNIKCQGSEIFIPSWKNKMGVIFSSPPYYNLEDYKIGEQSIIGKTYDEWLDDYMFNTLKNCEKYLINEGFLLINVKNFERYNLYNDTFNMVKHLKFKYIKTIKLINKTRPSVKIDINTNEKIMVFKKIQNKSKNKSKK